MKAAIVTVLIAALEAFAEVAVLIQINVITIVTVSRIPTNETAQLLRQWSRGDQDALDQLKIVVNDDLYKPAHSYLRQERPGHMLQPTAWVNEVSATRCGWRAWRRREMEPSSDES